MIRQLTPKVSNDTGLFYQDKPLGCTGLAMCSSMLQKGFCKRKLHQSSPAWSPERFDISESCFEQRHKECHRPVREDEGGGCCGFRGRLAASPALCNLHGGLKIVEDNLQTNPWYNI